MASMHVTMKTDNSVRSGAIMFVAQKLGVACCTVYHLWERATIVLELGIINSPEYILHKKLWKKGYVSN